MKLPSFRIKPYPHTRLAFGSAAAGLLAAAGLVAALPAEAPNHPYTSTFPVAAGMPVVYSPTEAREFQDQCQEVEMIDVKGDGNWQPLSYVYDQEKIQATAYERPAAIRGGRDEFKTLPAALVPAFYNGERDAEVVAFTTPQSHRAFIVLNPKNANCG